MNGNMSLNAGRGVLDNSISQIMNVVEATRDAIDPNLGMVDQINQLAREVDVAGVKFDRPRQAVACIQFGLQDIECAIVTAKTERRTTRNDSQPT